jgi:hypothetical protein
MAGGPVGVPPVDVSTGLPGARAVVLYPRAIAVLAAGPGPRFERTAWAFRRPVLPPGSTANRILSAAGRLWLATSRGLLEAASFDGPWRRAGVPAGSTPARAIASSTTDDTVLVASESGLLRGSPVLSASSSPAEAGGAIGPPVPVDPPIVAVQRASLGYLGIGPERMRELRRGVDRRGWLPDLSLRFAAASDRDRARDLDESFVSGETRTLHDRANDDSIGLDGSITMSWDLGDVAFAPDAIDVSREARLVISLRDDVLDEVNQLYFERQGVLTRLGGPGLEAADRRGLWLRARELGAGLDAWTGGWFSQQVRVTDRLLFPDAKSRERKHPDHGAQARPSAPRSTE